MKTLMVCCLAVLIAVLAGESFAGPQGKKVELFNGKDLTGWEHYLWNRQERKQDTQTPVSAVWSVTDGILICQGQPPGYIRTKDEYADYRLTLEWRWPEKGGNNGVLVHTTTPNALGVWPKSIEVQLASENAGDFWVIGTDLDVLNEELRKKDRRHFNLTDDSERPLGEWNKMEIRCQSNEIKVWVNGTLVNHATNCSETQGAISLQSEGTLIHFRNIVLEQMSE